MMMTACSYMHMHMQAREHGTPVIAKSNSRSSV